MATGDKVVAQEKTDVVRKLLQLFPKLAGIEMDIRGCREFIGQARQLEVVRRKQRERESIDIDLGQPLT